jgi:hypothetical protein
MIILNEMHPCILCNCTFPRQTPEEVLPLSRLLDFETAEIYISEALIALDALAYSISKGLRILIEIKTTTYRERTSP